MADDAARRRRPARRHAGRRYRRRSEELEFDRVAFFSDAVFAIAMTLLVVGIGIPRVPQGRSRPCPEHKDAEIFSFFLSFAVIGFYWLAHHRFFAHLAAVDVRFMRINLCTSPRSPSRPSPPPLVGIYGGDEPVGVVLYAVTSGVGELPGGRDARGTRRTQGLLRERMRDDVFRGNMAASLAPVAGVRDLDPDRVPRPIVGAALVAAVLPAEMLHRAVRDPEGRRPDSDRSVVVGCVEGDDDDLGDRRARPTSTGSW